MIRNGKVVAFPTETVYGLGAMALSETACEKIFKMKNRPLTNPLIVHVHNLKSALVLIDSEDKSIFTLLGKAYWPGPLTIVAKAQASILPPIVTANSGFVGVRVPNHKVALDFLYECDVPVAAPSANQFGHISPSKPEHVLDEFSQDVPVIDGGPCDVGIESTVVKIYKDENTSETIVEILR